MKRLLAILLLCTSAFATTTVTGNIKTLGVGNVTSGAFVRFWLRGCAGNQPRITGTGIIAPSQGGVYYFDLVANGSGAVSGTLFSTRDSLGTGNGDIECGGSYTAVWYGMQAFVAGKGGPEVPVQAKNGATLDISSVTPITTNPVIVAPTGDGTYLRLDAGNSPVTGAATFNAGVTLNSGLTLSGGGSLAGTLNISGAVNFTNLWSLANAGVFTNTQMNEFASSLIGGCNPQTEFQNIQGGTNFATDALTGCIKVPNTSTVFGGYAVAGYAETSSTTTGITAGKFYAQCMANGTQCFGWNPVVQDKSGLTSSVQLLGGEIDLQPQNGPSAYSLLIGAQAILFAPVAGNYGKGFFVGTGGSLSGRWATGFQVGDGAIGSSPAAAYIVGTLGVANPSNSQSILFNFLPSPSGEAQTNLFADSGGSLNIASVAGGGLKLGSGTIGQLNGINTVSNGVPGEYATVDLTAQGANIGATTLYAVPSTGAGLYRVSCYVIVTQAGTVSSTLPTCTIGWTDKDNSTGQSFVLTPTNTGNLLTTAQQAIMVLDAKASTNITYSTTGYATSGATSMQYAIHIKLEAL